MSYDNGMGPGPFFDNTLLPEYTSRPDPFHDKFIADAVQDILNPRVSQQAVDRIEAIYMKKIRQLQDLLTQTKKERDQLVVKKNAMENAFIEFGEKHGTPLEELKPLYKEKLKQESEKQGIPLD